MSISLLWGGGTPSPPPPAKEKPDYQARSSSSRDGRLSLYVSIMPQPVEDFSRTAKSRGLSICHYSERTKLSTNHCSNIILKQNSWNKILETKFLKQNSWNKILESWAAKVLFHLKGLPTVSGLVKGIEKASGFSRLMKIPDVAENTWCCRSNAKKRKRTIKQKPKNALEKKKTTNLERER